MLLTFLESPRKVENLWAEFQKINDSQVLPAYHAYEHFILALDFLYLAGALHLDEDGNIGREAN